MNKMVKTLFAVNCVLFGYSIIDNNPSAALCSGLAIIIGLIAYLIEQKVEK